MGWDARGLAGRDASGWDRLVHEPCPLGVQVSFASVSPSSLCYFYVEFVGCQVQKSVSIFRPRIWTAQCEDPHCVVTLCVLVFGPEIGHPFLAPWLPGSECGRDRGREDG